MIPSRLIWARRQNPIGTWSIAAKLGVTERTVKDWEKGRKRPTPQRVEQLAVLLKTTVIALTGPVSA